MHQPTQSSRGARLSVIIFLALLLLMWLGLLALLQLPHIPLPAGTVSPPLNGDGTHDVVYTASLQNWRSFTEKLYTPAQFAAALEKETPQSAEALDYHRVQYATHQLTLMLTPGRQYGISLVSADYAMRLFINEEQVLLVGLPGTTAAEAVPRTQECVYYFTPAESHVVVTVQVSNFVHNDGCYPPRFTIGSAAAITRLEKNNSFVNAVIVGCLFTAALYHLSLFILNRRRRVALVFAICCFLLMLVTHKLIPLFFPLYNWQLTFRFEYLVHVGTFIAFTRLMQTLFPRLLHHYTTRAFYAVCGIMLLCTLILPTWVFSGMLFYFHIVCVAMILYTLVRLAMALPRGGLQYILAFLGMLAVCFLGMNDILVVNNITFLGQFMGQIRTAPMGMVLFVFCYMQVVSLEFAEAQRRIEEAQRLVAEMAQRHRTLLEETKPNGRTSPGLYLDQLALSTREREVAYLLLGGKQRGEIAELLNISMGTVHTYCNRIYQKAGCANIGEFNRMLGMPQ